MREAITQIACYALVVFGGLKINKMKKIRITKISGEKSHSTSMEIGESRDGVIIDGSVFPDKPIVGRPFATDTYKTSIVRKIINDAYFETYNARYHWKEI